MVEADDPERARGSSGEASRRRCHGGRSQASGLVPPRPHGVDADHVQPVRRVDGLRRLPLPKELLPGPGEAGGWQERDVVVARHGQDGRRQGAEQRGHSLVLVTPAAVGEVARGDDEIGSDPLHERSQRSFQSGLLAGADMDVGDVDQAPRHSRSRLYTGLVPDESTESTELFDDLYLGLRAGGAIRKQRRGEPLTTEEEAALGHWQRLSSWRKVIAVGAFALGTFGLGFTLGGLVFRRRRNA
jgi:hypothetical protein